MSFLSPNEVGLWKELSKARLIVGLAAVNSNVLVRDKGPRCPKPTKYSIRSIDEAPNGTPRAYYIFFDDGSIRRAALVGRGMTFERKLVAIKRRRGPAQDAKRLRRTGNAHLIRSRHGRA